VDVAGVGWILAKDWWPYQRPSFVTPPFAGFPSGHSAFSRAAATVLDRFTGSPFFPGGMGEFHAPRNQFLVFEDGPSVDLTLQYATYYDASDQTSLSRIWGGIHPPQDDLVSRHIGVEIADDAFAHALSLFATPPACANGLDDDGDGHVDFPDDPACPSPGAITEARSCQNGRDDDGDGGIDFDGGASWNGGTPLGPPDARCIQPTFHEGRAGCGLGPELAPGLALLVGLRRRHARRRAA
jgi:hypothetical protein